MGSACSRGMDLNPVAQSKLSATVDQEEKSLRSYKPPSPKKPNFGHTRSPSSSMLDQRNDEQLSITRVSSVGSHRFEYDDEALEVRAERMENLMERIHIVLVE